MNPSQTIFDAICGLLTKHEAKFEVIEHPPARTSQESSIARGEPLEVDAKALLLKCDTDFILVVMRGDMRLDSKSTKQSFGVRRIRFANSAELHVRTGLVPGAVPPFGEPILPFQMHVDLALRDNERIAFNAGSLTKSIIMPAADYFRVATPDFRRLAQEGDN